MILNKEQQSLILDRVVREVKEYLGDKLDRVILYGSYARGDYEEYSDVDILILANIEHATTREYMQAIWNISHNISLENDVILSLTFRSTEFFNANVNTHSFYRNVVKDGRLLYEFDNKQWASLKTKRQSQYLFLGTGH